MVRGKESAIWMNLAGSMLVGEMVNPMKGVQNFRKRPGGSACFEDTQVGRCHTYGLRDSWTVYLPAGKGTIKWFRWSLYGQPPYLTISWAMSWTPCNRKLPPWPALQHSQWRFGLRSFIIFPSFPNVYCSWVQKSWKFQVKSSSFRGFPFVTVYSACNQNCKKPGTEVRTTFRSTLSVIAWPDMEK